jgi:hypothetical protein
MFRERLESKLLNDNKKNNAGAKPYDVVMMFNIIILQKYYNISDEQVEYQINDRTSFKDYLVEIKFLIQEPSGFLDNV